MKWAKSAFLWEWLKRVVFVVLAISVCRAMWVMPAGSEPVSREAGALARNQDLSGLYHRINKMERLLLAFIETCADEDQARRLVAHYSNSLEGGDDAPLILRRREDGFEVEFAAPPLRFRGHLSREVPIETSRHVASQPECPVMPTASIDEFDVRAEEAR